MGSQPARPTPIWIPHDQILRVSETHVFPGFDPGTTHGDAALLVLSSPTAAPPIPLASAADQTLYGGGARVQLAGWGVTRPDARSAPNNLRTTSTVVLDGPSCKRQTRSFNPPYTNAAQMCTTDPPGQKTAAASETAVDRRSPSVPTARRSSWASPAPWVRNCDTRLPDVFTRVDTVSTWASEWVAAVETGAPPPVAKPRLPKLTRESAEGFVVSLLRSELGNLFVYGRGLRGRCGSLGSPRVKCELAWVHGSRVYFAKVTVFYVLGNDAVELGQSLPDPTRQHPLLRQRPQSELPRADQTRVAARPLR